MSCIALVGGVIGCGKTTLINYLLKNESAMFRLNSNEINSNEFENNCNRKTPCKIILDDLCSIEEQAKLMNSLKGWKCFRVDLLMAAEHFISSLVDSKFIMHGPLTARSFNLLEKLNKMNERSHKDNHFVFLSEDNFYYRSMRYDWFQLSKRANIGFCEIFVECPLDVAISRNFSRGYSIPEERIKRMLTFMEYPDPEKYKWEKFSIAFNTSDELNNTSLIPIADILDEAAKNPAEMMIMSDKIQAQSICSKNVVHQADKILRKLVSKTIFSKRGEVSGDMLNQFSSLVLGVRQNVLNLIKNGEIEFPRTLLENLKHNGVDCVKSEFEDVVVEKFEEGINEKLFENETLFSPSDSDSRIMSLKVLTLNNGIET